MVSTHLSIYLSKGARGVTVNVAGNGGGEPSSIFDKVVCISSEIMYPTLLSPALGKQ